MKPKKKEGRPTKLNQDVLNKLEEAFLLGCTDTEACLMAGISHQTLYNWQNANPEFLERKTKLKANPIIEARQSLKKAIKRGDGKLSLAYLERKVKDELSLRTEHSGLNGEPIEFKWVE